MNDFSLRRCMTREVIDSNYIVFYHGTLKSAIPSIMKTGLRATEGWGGAARPGVFLSASFDDAVYWSKMSTLKKMGLEQKESNFDEVPDDEVAVLEIHIPDRLRDSLVPRNKSFNLSGDIQFVGATPPEWISVASERHNEDKIRKIKKINP